MEDINKHLYETFNQAEQLGNSGEKDEAILRYCDFISEAQGVLAQRKQKCHQLANDDVQQLHDKLSLAYNNRGFLYYLKVEFKLAVEDYTQALHYNSDMAVAYYNRGLIHYRLSRFQEAVEDLKKAVSLQPDLEPAQLCLKQSLEDLQRTSNR